LTFALELGVPWMYLMGRQARLVGAVLTAGLMAMIQLTGNYTFFNMLSAALALPLVDDGYAQSALNRVAGLVGWALVDLPSPADEAAASKSRRAVGWSDILTRIATALYALGVLLVAVFLVTAAVVPLARLANISKDQLPPAVRDAHTTASAYSLVGNYGLFARMTQSRPEVCQFRGNSASLGYCNDTYFHIALGSLAS
jgi:lipase maturation factor